MGYMDSQAFLRDWLTERNKRAPRLSFEGIAQELGLRSRGHAYRVFHDPAVPITQALAIRLGALLGLAEADKQYFETLVSYNRATRLDEKNRYLQRLRHLSGSKPGNVLDSSAESYMAEWYMPVLREALCLPNFKGNYKLLAKSLGSPLTEAKVRQCVEQLLELGLIRKLPGDRFAQTDAHVHVGSSVQKVLLAGFQQQMLRKASAALDELEAAKRHITTLTFSFPMSKMATLKAALARLQDELIQEIRKEPDGHDSVLQFNMQLFPVSQPLEKAEKKHES